MARTYFSKERNKWVTERVLYEHYALAFDAKTNEPIFDGDMVRAEIFQHGEYTQIKFLCFDRTNARYVNRIIARDSYKYHFINGIPHHYIQHSQTIRYFKINKQKALKHEKIY